MRFDLETAATCLGMRMTVDGSGDDLIRIPGVEWYLFDTEEDGSASGVESDDDDFGKPVGSRGNGQAVTLHQGKMRAAAG